MANDTKHGTMHIDQRLSNFSLLYSNGEFVADLASPRIKVAKDSDKYAIYGKEHFRIPDALRADGAESRRDKSFSVTDGSYQCEEYALHDMVTYREKANADNPVDPEMDATNGLTEKLLLAREKRVADLFTTTANLASGHYTTLSGTSQFNNASFSSTGITTSIEYRLETGKEVVRQAIGRKPNMIVIPSAVASIIKKDAAIRDLIKYTKTDLLTNGGLPGELFGMKVIEPGSIYDSAAHGGTFSGTDVWGKHIVMLYMPQGVPGKRSMTFTLTFEQRPRQVKRWDKDELEAIKIETSEFLTEKIVANNAAYLIRDAIA